VRPRHAAALNARSLNASVRRHEIVRYGVLRWGAVPPVVVASYYLAFLLFLKIELSCLGDGLHPNGRCSDWWADSHSWVGAVVFGFALFLGPILLPTALAPRFKGIVGGLAFGVVAVHTISEFDFWAWSVAMSIVTVSAAALGITFRHGLFRGNSVA